MHRFSEYLKYKVLTGDQELLSMDAGKEGCVGANAALWEVLHGRSEWDAVYQSLNAATRRATWINAQALQTCSDYLGMDLIKW